MAECTIYDKLRYIAETKDLIKTAIETQDVEVLESDTFRKYAEYITEIRKVASVNGETGDIILKTINGQNLVGEGNISIQGGEGGGGITEETDPIFTEWKNGDSIALGKDSTNEGSNNIAIGNAVKANGEYSIAIGAATIYDEGTEYEEIYPTEANGEGSIAIGNETIANNASLTIGSYNNINNASVALGMWNTITSDNSLAVGNNNSLEGGSFKFAYGFFNEPKNNQEINIGVLCKSRTGNTDSERTHFVISSYNNRNGEDNTSCFEIRNDDSIYIKMDGQLVKLQDKLNINIPETDLSDYYTKGEVYNKNEVNELIDEVNAGDVDLTNYYTKQEVDDKIPSLSGYATEQWVEGKNYLTEHQSLEDYAKKTDIPDVSEFIKEIPSEYITEEELNGKGYLTSIPDTYVTDGELSTAISDKVSQTALNEAIEGVENKIPSLDGYATEQWVEDKKYLTEHQSLEDYAKKSDIPTIPTSNTAFTNDAGFITLNEVPETDLSDYYTKTETYSKDEVDGLLENSGGSTAGVEAINIGTSVQDWTQKTGIVSFYTQMYDGGYEVAADGMSFFGIKPADDTIIIEQGGGTVNGCFRGTIRVNPDVLGGGGSGNAPTLQEGKVGTTDNYIYSNGDQNSDNCVLASVSLTKSVNANQVGITQNVKLWGDSSFNGKDAITIYGASETNAGVMTAEDKVKLETLVANSGNTGGGSSLNIIELTQAEYDALSEKQTNAIYVITDAVELKFKTINGQEITGEGDIEISGGGSTVGVNKIILGEEDYGWNTYRGDIKLNANFNDYGYGMFYDISLGGKDVDDNNSSTVWFGFRSSDNSIKLEDGGGRVDLKVNEWVGSQEDYDALGNYDNNCTYYII